MAALDFASSLGGTLALDLCWSCQGIWFDPHESTQLAPAGVIALFKAIHDNHQPTQPLAGTLACPRCARPLAYRQDRTRSGRFAYHQCAADQGRFTPFTQFLLEKGFVRSLTPVEIARLKAQVRIIRCAGCGAPVDLQHDTACPHCRSPIAVLDAQAVDKALTAYNQAGQRNPALAWDVLADQLMQREHERLADERAAHGGAGLPQATDLILGGVRAVARALG
jgi:hypothetical protein